MIKATPFPIWEKVGPPALLAQPVAEQIRIVQRNGDLFCTLEREATPQFLKVRQKRLCDNDIEIT
jgi:hypothetical protein